MPKKKRKAPAEQSRKADGARRGAATAPQGAPGLAVPSLVTGRKLGDDVVLWGADGRVMNPVSLGNLRPATPGSNNGVHRGPDKFPRRHVIRALVLGVLGDTGPMPIRDPITGRIVRRLGGDIAVFPAKFVGLMLLQRALNRVLMHGTNMEIIKVTREFHEILQDAKGEAPEAPPPQRAVFVLEKPPAPPTRPTEDDEEAGTSSIVDHEGNVYVSA